VPLRKAVFHCRNDRAVNDPPSSENPSFNSVEPDWSLVVPVWT
jgi:hypothetical protein